MRLNLPVNKESTITATRGRWFANITASHALKTPKVYSQGYVYKPNVDVEIWGVFLKTGGSMHNSGCSLAVLRMIFVHLLKLPLYSTSANTARLHAAFEAVDANGNF